MSDSTITLSHGAGGMAMRRLVRDLFARHFDNPCLRSLSDAAVLTLPGERIAFTTDSYVVKPIEFAGGDIGKLAVCGTVNDLVVMGARPLCLSAGFILEEGLKFDRLERIVASMANEARLAEVDIVTGDTKVVPRGECDQLFINTSGIGIYPLGHGLCSEPIVPGDAILISGTVGEHGIAVLSARNQLSFEADIQSDCATLHGLIRSVLNESNGVKWMRDATRGGVAAVMSEFVENMSYGVLIEEPSIPVRRDVTAVCELLGFDPLHLANEGKIVLVCQATAAGHIVRLLNQHPLGINAVQIGVVTAEGAGHVRLRTISGGIRRLHRPIGELLPRIC